MKFLTFKKKIFNQNSEKLKSFHQNENQRINITNRKRFQPIK